MNTLVASFNNGEITPRLDARSDVEKYSSSCRTLENSLPTIYGGVDRRPGTEYVATAKTSTAVRLIEFKFSASIAYVCEFGEHYIRFFYNGAPLLVGGVPVEVLTPYLATDLPSLQYHQIGDVMWLVNSGYAQRKLSRISATTFTLNTISFRDGPFLTRNDLDDNGVSGVTMTSSVTAAAATGTLTASAATFVAGHVGAIWQLVHPRTTTQIALQIMATGTTTAIAIKGAFAFKTIGGGATATLALERSTDGGANWNTHRRYTLAGTNIAVTLTEKDAGITYRINVESYTEGNTTTAYISPEDVDLSGIVRVASLTSATVANIQVLSEVGSTAATKRWAEGTWSDYRGHPGAIAFYEGRCVYGATTHDPQTVWLSASDDYENFDADVLDSSSFDMTLTITNRIRWIESLENLVVGSVCDEWVISSNKLGNPLTPTSFSARQQLTYGSSDLQPIKWAKSVLFVEYAGRKLRELTYSMGEDQYVAPDLATMAEHLTLGGLKCMAVQKSPEVILWFVRGDGVLLSLTYNRDQNVVAWARHPMTGAIVNSVCIVPGTTEDEVWLAVTRTINGVAMQFIERMTPRVFATQGDCFYVDCGLSYNGASATSFAGLDHLEGETVAILGDGAVFPTQVVNGGTVTLPTAVTKAAIGLPYRYTILPMRLDAKVSGIGDTKGNFKRIPELVFSFFQSGGAMYGRSLTALYAVPFPTNTKYGTAPALFSGDVQVSFDAGFETEDYIYVTGTDPLPCCLRAIVARFKQV